MNKPSSFTLTRPIIGLLVAATVGVMQLAPIPAAVAQEDGHAGHDHGAESAPKQDEHAGHDDHGDEGGGHEGHAGHGEEESNVIRIDPAVMREYGITVEEAVARNLEQTLRLPGEVVFNADRVAHVTPSVAGIVQKVNPSVGDRVEAGDVMAVLSSRELAAARSDFLGAKARLELERETLSRQETLLKDRIGTETETLQARKAVREEEIALNLAEQNLHALGQSQEEVDALDGSAETKLSEYHLKAPLSGVVIVREVTRGEVVSEQPDETPFIVADLSSVWVNLTVYQKDLVRVRAGMPVQIEFGHGIPDASGTISYVSPAVDEQTRTATARIVLDNPDGVWRPGLFITGQVAVGETVRGESSEQIIAVPKSALQTVGEDHVVFVQTAEGFEPRPVEVGKANATHAQILSGLRAGERYVSKNAFALKSELNRASLEHAGHAH